jgi:hypothetical protein
MRVRFTGGSRPLDGHSFEFFLSFFSLKIFCPSLHLNTIIHKRPKPMQKRNESNI